MQGRSTLQQKGSRLDGAEGLLLDRVGVRGVLEGISLAAPTGRLLAILGEPGSGKSTLMTVLAGFTAASAGKISWRGANLSAIAPHRRGFGVVAQDDSLFPGLSLAENLVYPLRLRGVGRRDRARMLDAALESILLEHPCRLPAAATPAERQRAWIARATIFGPSVLLLDEPLAHQDHAQRGTLVAALRRLHLWLGTTTILTTSVASDALALGDYLAILNRGQIIQAGTPEAIYERPGSALAAMACGDANLLPGIVRAIDEDGVARVGLACGPAAQGATGSGLRVRDHCVVCVRPERIAVAPVEASEMGDAALDATVLEALNLGETVRLRLLVGAGQELLVKRPAAAGMRGMRPGQHVAIAWQAEHAVVFPSNA